MTTEDLTPIDVSHFPPALVLWLLSFIDIVCGPLQCREWRKYVPWTDEGEWLSYKVGRIATALPDLLTYRDFVVQLEQPPEKDWSWTLKSIWKYSFETPSTALADLTTPTAAVALLLLVFVFRIVKAVLLPMFSSWGRRVGRHTHGLEWEKKNSQRIQKFGEYLFRLCFHTAISVCGVWYFWDKEWWKRGGTPTLFRDYPFHEVAPGMAWYYLIQAAYNLEALISLLTMSIQVKLKPFGIGWSPTVRGDFREMALHHVVTNLLIIGSSFFRFSRIGSMVFLVHDVSDVPVDLSKLANFLKWKLTTIVCFATMVLVWLLTRLFILPFVIHRSVITESWLVTVSGVIDPIYYACYQPVFSILIGFLILLHVIWFGLFITMGYYLAFKGEAHDFSEHKHGEVQHQDQNLGTSNHLNGSHNSTSNKKVE